RPPVALLVYPPAAPGRGVFYPFAVFSPEWQALRWAAQKRVPARFIDLPQAVSLARTEHPDERGPRDDPIEMLARAAGYDDPEEWWEHHIEQRREPEGM